MTLQANDITTGRCVDADLDGLQLNRTERQTLGH